MDEPLWFLSKYGCSKLDKSGKYCRFCEDCVVKEFCVICNKEGYVIVNSSFVEMET